MTTVNTGNAPQFYPNGSQPAAAPAQPGVGQYTEPVSRVPEPAPMLPNAPVAQQRSEPIAPSLLAEMERYGLDVTGIQSNAQLAEAIARLAPVKAAAPSPAPVQHVAAQPSPVQQAPAAYVPPQPQVQSQPDVSVQQALAMLNPMEVQGVRFNPASQSFEPALPEYSSAAARANMMRDQAVRLAKVEAAAAQVARDNALLNLADTAVLNQQTGQYELTPAGSAFQSRYDMLVQKGFDPAEANAMATEAYRLVLLNQQRQAQAAAPVQAIATQPVVTTTAAQPTYAVAQAFQNVSQGMQIPTGPAVPARSLMDMTPQALYDMAAAEARQKLGAIPAVK